MKIKGAAQSTVDYLSIHPCSYYKDEALLSQMALLIPPKKDNGQHLGDQYRDFTKQMIPQGFLDGGLTPKFNICANCQRCVPARINVNAFTPSRSQRRILKRNSDLTTSLRSMYNAEWDDIALTEEHYALFSPYMKQKHPTDAPRSLTNMSQNEFINHYEKYDWVSEVRDNSGKLLCASVLTVGDDFIYGINFFYDIQESKRRSLGKFAILGLIEALKETGRIQYYYLGGLAQNSDKLGYKTEFSGLEVMTTAGWTAYDPSQEYTTPDYEALLPLSMNWPYREAHKFTRS